jgi:hypothetical protein
MWVNTVRAQLSRARKFLRRAVRLLACAAVLALAAVVVFTVHCRPTRLLFSPTPETVRHPAQAAGVANYARPEVDTFYTYPEWYIVWSYQSKADFQSNHLPSGYSYFGDIGQFWQAYCCVYAATRANYPFPTGDHIMLAVIGSSFTMEYALKGLYEETVGRLSEATSHHQAVAEDTYAAQIAESYAAFVHIRPFYEFSFAHALRGLWGNTPFRATHMVRIIERRAWLTLDYSVEAVYCEMIELGTHATYGFEDTTTAAWVEFSASDKTLVSSPPTSVKVVRDLGDHQAIVEIPRYQEFTPAALGLIHEGARFRQIAGNELIVISAISPASWTNTMPNVQLLLAQPLLTEPGNTRNVLLCRVVEFHIILPMLEHQGLKIEHLYDY